MKDLPIESPQKPDNSNAQGFVTGTLSPSNEPFISNMVRFIPGDPKHRISAHSGTQPGPVDIIDLVLPEKVEAKEYSFENGPGIDNVYGTLARRGSPDGGAYPYSSQTGTMVLTEVDHSTPRFKGTFHFTGKNSKNNEISIINGEFDVSGNPSGR